MTGRVAGYGKVEKGGRVDERLEEIRARVAAASEGPWGEYHQDYNAGWYSDGVYSQDKGQWIIAANNAACAVKATPADRAFIAHARTDVPYLLDRLTHSQGRIAELSAALLRYGHHDYDCPCHLVSDTMRWVCVCGYAVALREQQPTTLTKEGGGG